MSTVEVQPRETSRKLGAPELLAPAGDRTCMIAAVENGADAVYFGLQGHNARARATNFDPAGLPEVMSFLHRRGVKGYVTMNTLVFPRELEDLEILVRQAAEAGVDALIVQDVGLARLIRAITPDLEIHASTQMSVTSAQGVELARELGCSRVILARELSLREIAKIREETDLPVEVFVHGALCVAYSGQCLTSEALGGRSANRGECAQACRLPYEIVCDGEVRDLREIKYLLSPQDLAAHDLIPELVALGVSSLKIEGRLKTPEYVANITRHYRSGIDSAVAGRPIKFEPREVQEMELSFSRGFSHGFFDGNNHKILVRGDYAKKRGVFVGVIQAIVGDRVRLDLAAPVKPGDGLVFDGSETDGTPEQGGRVYEVARASSRSSRTPVGPEGLSAGPAELGFGRRDIDVRRLRLGQRAWKTDDPELTRRLRQSFEGPPRRKVTLNVHLEAIVGKPLRLEARATNGAEATIEGEELLIVAANQPANQKALRTQFDRLGGTIYELGEFEAEVESGPLVPRSVLNGLRRDLIEKLDSDTLNRPRSIAGSLVLPTLRPTLIESTRGQVAPSLSVLCRTTGQIEAALASGIRTIYADFSEIKRYQEAVATARSVEGSTIYLATPRIEKPGEANIFRFLGKLGADGLLVRNAGGIAFCADRDIPFVADFSLNAANELAVEFYKAKGATRVTASFDLSFEQLEDLLKTVPLDWLEIVIHQQIPMFHMEFCAFSAHLSNGKPNPDCGRPCDHHDVKLRDRTGVQHPLKADVGCRNTLFSATPQTAAEFLPRLLSCGTRNLRIEFLDDSPASVGRIIGLYRDVIEGRRDPKNLWRELKATNQYGVTRGALAIIQ